jgi:hypothetical protein
MVSFENGIDINSGSVIVVTGTSSMISKLKKGITSEMTIANNK